MKDDGYKELVIKNSVPNSRNARMQIGFAFLRASVSLGVQLPPVPGMQFLTPGMHHG